MLLLKERTKRLDDHHIFNGVHETATMTAVGGDRCLLDDSSLPPPYSEIPGVVPLHTGRWSGPPPSYDDVVNPDGQFPPLGYSLIEN